MSTHYLGLKYGSDEIALSGGTDGVILGGYAITPARTAFGGMYETVRESLTLHFEGASTSAMQSNFQAVESLLQEIAYKRAMGEGDPLYLEWQPAGDSTRWRTELRGARLVPDQQTAEQWANALMTVRFEVEREPFFWGARTAIPISNRHGSATTAGLTIHNRQDASRDAHFDIAAGVIDGTVAAPLELELTNTDGAGRSYEDFYIGVNAKSDPANYVPTLEAEAESTSFGSTTAFASASGGNVRQFTVNADTTIYPKWVISSTLASDLKGRYVRVLVKLGSHTEGHNWQMAAAIYEQYGLVPLYTGRSKVLPGVSSIVDLGLVPVPPMGYAESLAEQRLTLIIRHEHTASSVLNIDYIFLMPTDSGRTILQRGMQIPANDEIIFDEIEKVWVSNESNLKHPIYSPRGPGVLVFPNVAQQVFILHNRDSTSDPADTMSVKAWYRPRRLSY